MYIDGWSQLPYAKGNMFWELSKVCLEARPKSYAH
jgi:hypothetical protein